MKTTRCVWAACLAAGFGVQAFADNPISSYHYLADPSAAADDSTFYILTDVDDYSVQKNYDYDIVGLYAFSSKDMKNWTDHGMIFRSKREFGDYPGNTWASGIAVKNGNFYIVYPDGASGVGMITSKSIDGPYIDPVMETHGKPRIAGGNSVIGDCDGIAHCFDPGIYVEDDGTGYVVFGGGENGQRRYGNNLDIIKFTESNGKITFDKNSLTRITAPGSFEAPYIHKRDGIYYLSFNTQPQVIDYSMSKNIMGPYDFVGTVIPGISSVPDAHNEGGNNHQGFAEFKGKWYAVYHDRRLVTADEHPASCPQREPGTCYPNPNPENHRSVSIDEITWNGDKMNQLKFTREGPEQIADFNPYATYKALTSSKQRNVRSQTVWTKGQPVLHVLTPLATKESWIRVSGVDFGDGAKSFRVTAASIEEGNSVEIHVGSASGTLAGTCGLQKTAGWDSFEDNTCEVTGLSGIVEQLFMVFKGKKDSTMGLIEWEFIGEGGSSVTTQTPHGGVATQLPGKVEAENYDDGGTRRAYSDQDAENQGDAEVRTTEAVDLVLGGSGVAIGYTNAGEWVEYTVDVQEDGEYPIIAMASSGAETSAFCFLVDGKPFGDTVKVTKTGEDWSVYEEFSAGKGTLTKGLHEIRLVITGDNVNVDWFAIGDPDANQTPVAIPENPKDTTAVVPGDTLASKDSLGGEIGLYKVDFMQNNVQQVYSVFNANGTKIGSVSASSVSEACRVWKLMNRTARGVNFIRSRNGKVVPVNLY